MSGRHGHVTPYCRRMRWAKRVLIGVAVLLLVGLVAAFGYLKVQSDRAVALPAPSGPDRVGRVVYDWVDQSRMDPFAPNGSTPRELSVWIWYPAEPAPGARTASYWPADWQRALGEAGGINDLVHTRPALIHPHAVDDASVANSQRQYPVLVFAPGQGLSAADYTTIAEDLASNGYVVAGINPTYSVDVVLSSGRVVRSVAKAQDANYGQLVSVWADDMRFVARQMDEISTASSGRFSGRLESTRIGFFGHSLGGAAAVQACRHDDRCPGAVDLDGRLGGDVLQTGLGKPFLFLGSDGSLTDGAVKAQVRSALRGVPAGQGHVLTVAGAAHHNFTDHGVYFDLVSSISLGSIDGVRALHLSSSYLRAFFTSYLLGRTDLLMTGPSATYPEVHAESV
jgi:dienelactone hydrolase